MSENPETGKNSNDEWKEKVNSEKNGNGKFELGNHHKVVTVILDPNTRECVFQVKNVQGKYALFSVLREALYQLEKQESVQATANMCTLNIMNALGSEIPQTGRLIK